MVLLVLLDEAEEDEFQIVGEVVQGGGEEVAMAEFAHLEEGEGDLLWWQGEVAHAGLLGVGDLVYYLVLQVLDDIPDPHIQPLLLL